MFFPVPYYMNAACLRCNLRTLNQHQHLMTGPYKKQFIIPRHSSNANFVNNPYQPHRCHRSDLVCVSLTQGALKCRPDTSLMLGFDAQGRLVNTKARMP